MMKYLSIQIQNDFPEEQAQFLLEQEGLTFLFSTKNEFLEISTSWCDHSSILKERFSWILSISEHTYEQVDWEDQWQIHGQNYQDGKATIDLTPYGYPNSFQMIPGPGFGDLSHPTTRLVLKLMLPLAQQKIVMDIGCGSGVLSLAALAAGAEQVYAIDIAPQALEHTENNAKLNGFHQSILCTLPENLVLNSLPNNWLVLMNMIHSEQCVAWESVHSHFDNTHLPCDIITSGILDQDKKTYLEQTEKWGWSLHHEVSEGQWAAFHFSKP
jgi:ribosomal protein L11 methyltransferase